MLLSVSSSVVLLLFSSAKNPVNSANGGDTLAERVTSCHGFTLLIRFLVQNHATFLGITR